MRENRLSLIFLNVIYGLYLVAMVMLVARQPTTESLEQLYYIASLVLFFPLSLFIASAHYVAHANHTSLIPKQVVTLSAFLTLGISLARASAFDLALVTLSIGIIVSLLLRIIITRYAYPVTTSFGIWVLLIFLIQASLNVNLVIVAIATLILLLLYERQQRDTITISSTLALIAASHFFAISILIPVSAILAVLLVGIGRFPEVDRAETPTHSKPKHLLDALIIILIVLFTFDLSLPYDTPHYNFYLAVINDLIQGKSMLVETYSLYGMSMPYFITIPFALDWLPLTPRSLSFINFTLTCIQFILIYGILRQLTTSVLWSSLGVGLIIFFNLYHVTYNGHFVNPMVSPAGGVLRYGWFAVLFALVATRYRHPGRARLLYVIEWIVIAIIASWSLEATIFVVVPYIVMSIYQCADAADGKIIPSLRLSLVRVAQILGAIVTGLIVFVFFTVIRAGTWPSFVPYLQFFTSYSNDTYAADTTFLIYLWSPWVLVAGIYLIYLSYIGQAALKRDFPLPFPVVGILFAGILSSYYWIGNSSTQSLLVIWPLVLLVYGLWERRDDPRLMPITGIITTVTVMLLTAIGLMYGQSSHRGIPFTMWSYLTDDRPPEILPLNDALLTYYNLYTGATRYEVRAESAIELAETYISEDEPLSILITSNPTIVTLLELDRTQAYPFTIEGQDFLSPQLLDQIRSYTDNLEIGHSIITLRHWDDISSISASIPISVSYEILESICQSYGIIERQRAAHDVVLLEVVEQTPETRCDAYWDWSS